MPRQNFTVELLAPYVTYSSGTTTNSPVRSASESTTGVSRRKPVTGWIPPTPYSYKHTRYDLPNDALWECTVKYAWETERTVSQRYTGNVYRADSGNGPFVGLNRAWIDPVSPSVLRDRALVKARIAMKNQDVNLGVAFAERDKTARLLGDTASQIAKSLRALRKGDFKRAARELGINKPKRPRGSSVTSRWLELQYGWKPLLSDVYGSAHALASRENRDWRVTGKGSSKHEFDVSTWYNGGGAHIQNGTSRVKGWHGCFVRIDAIPANDLLQALASLGITNPLEIAWELVPFSFVLDWMLPVGDFLSSLDAMLGYDTNNTSTSVSMFKKEFRTHVADPVTIIGDYYDTRYVRRGMSASSSLVELTRSVPATVPLPTFPRLKDPRSLGHMANGLSLLASVLSGRR